MTRSLFLTFSLLLFGLTVFPQKQPGAPVSRLRKKIVQAQPVDKVRLLCELALEYVFKPGEMASDLDTALLMAKQAEAINGSLKSKASEARINFVKSNALREKGDTAAGHAAINKALAIYASINEPLAFGDAYIELAMYYPYSTSERLFKFKECYQKALSQFEAAGDKQKQASALQKIGDCDQALNNYGLAIINLQKSLTLYKSIGNKELQGIYDLLGIIYTRLGDIPNGIKNGLLALQTAEQVKDTTDQLCTIYFRLSQTYSAWKKTKEAFFYAKKSVMVALKSQDKNNTTLAIMNLCQQQVEHSDWRETLRLVQITDSLLRPWSRLDSTFMLLTYTIIYSKGKDFNNASKYANYLIDLIPRIGTETMSLHIVRGCLAQYYLDIKQFAKAKKMISDGLNSPYAYYDKNSLLKLYLMQATADSGMHQYKLALRNYQKYKILSDSLINETKTFQVAQMQVIYETDKKDQDIKIQQQYMEVVKNKNKVQEVSLNKATLLRNVIVIAALFLIFLLIARYNIKQRHNRKLEFQQKEISDQNVTLKEILKEQQKLVAEKEWLVKEIHHRVKNNLQMIISLLNAQSEFLDHPSAINAIKESRERMQAISLIHQKLYQPGQGTFIDMAGYIRELVNCICNSFPDTDRIKFNLYLENIELDVAQSVPLGLILNEAITNIVKYAFQKRQKGNVEIRFRKIDNTNLLLSISDNGKGLPVDFDLSEHNSLGMQLIQLFSEQLEGDLHLTSNNGLEISLTFQRQYSLNKSLSLINSG